MADIVREIAICIQFVSIAVFCIDSWGFGLTFVNSGFVVMTTHDELIYFVFKISFQLSIQRNETIINCSIGE